MASNVSKISKVRRKVKNFDQNKFNSKVYAELQERLRKLVEEHGLECVSEATGLAQSTVSQYIRVSLAPSMSRTTIEKAEIILKGL